MSKTVEITGTQINVVDSDKGIVVSAKMARSLSVTRERYKTVSVAAGAADQAISFDGITAAKLIYLVAAAELTYKLNTYGPIPLEPMALHASDDGDFTALSVSNPDGSNAVELEVLIAGS